MVLSAALAAKLAMDETRFGGKVFTGTAAQQFLREPYRRRVVLMMARLRANLDHVRAPQLQECLARGATVGDPLVQDLDAERQLVGQALAQRGRDVGHLRVGRAAVPQLRPDLVRAVGGLAPGGQALPELRPREVVDGRHRVPA